MGIKFKRQGGGSTNYNSATAPTSLNYGEPAVDSEGRIYVGNGQRQVVSRVKMADSCTNATNATSATTAVRATNASNADRAKFDLPLYHAYLSASSWSNYGSYYTQSANCYAESGGPSMTSGMQLSPPMTQGTGVQSTDESLMETLNIINAGTTTPGYGRITVKVWEKPETDITVYYYAR